MSFSFSPFFLKFKRWIRLYLKFDGKIMSFEYSHNTHAHITIFQKKKLFLRPKLVVPLNKFFSRVPTAILFQFDAGKKLSWQNYVFQLRLSFFHWTHLECCKKIKKALLINECSAKKSLNIRRWWITLSFCFPYWNLFTAYMFTIWSTQLDKCNDFKQAKFRV